MNEILARHDRPAAGAGREGHRPRQLHDGAGGQGVRPGGQHPGADAAAVVTFAPCRCSLPHRVFRVRMRPLLCDAPLPRGKQSPASGRPQHRIGPKDVHDALVGGSAPDRGPGRRRCRLSQLRQGRE